MSTIRRALDALYYGCGVVAAGFLLLLLGIIVAQMVARWSGVLFPGAASYAGYAMAASSFFGFAHALNRGAHIRVGLLLAAVGPAAQRRVEIWCFAIGAAAAWYLARYAINLVSWSWTLGDVSQGQDATPLWIPQSGMAIGAIVFAVALTDHLVQLILTGRHGIEAETTGMGDR